jgi:hypothetical protein
MDSDTTHEVNQLRLSVGLRPIEPKVRKCLKCDSKFESTHIGNRICDRCHGTNAAIEPEEVLMEIIAIASSAVVGFFIGYYTRKAPTEYVPVTKIETVEVIKTKVVTKYVDRIKVVTQTRQ